jgi:uncharacterized protein involved in outer membrane biogenesis
LRLIGKIFGIVFALLIAVVIGVFFWISDANRLKPELALLIQQNSEYTIQFNGDLAWALWPPISLTVEDLVAESKDKTDPQTITAGRIEAKLDLSAIWQDVDKWQVTRLNVTRATITDDTGTTTIPQFELANFRPGEPAKFSAVIEQPGTDPITTAKLSGQLTYWLADDGQPDRIALKNTKVVADDLTAVCEADITENANAPQKIPKPAADALLPSDTLLEYDFTTQCTISSLTVGTETFTSGRLDATNVNGKVNANLNIKDFLGGSLVSDVDINTRAKPMTWHILPQIKDVDSQRLLDWSQQKLQWVALIGLNSSIRMTGNTTQQLMNSIKAQSDFDGGQGQLNISKIKTQLMQLAALGQKQDDVTKWPDVWDYKSFTGNWVMEGQKHALKFALDNMSVKADGIYDLAADNLDFLANVTIHEAQESTPFKINPLLQGTAIPIRCKGPSADPKCKLDENAAKNLIAKAFQRGDDSGLRKKLETKIDDEVPEQYRETARSLLDILGRSLEGKEKEKEAE